MNKECMLLQMKLGITSLEIAMQGMVAENQRCIYEGQDVMYSEEDFAELLKQAEKLSEGLGKLQEAEEKTAAKASAAWTRALYGTEV